MKESYIHDLIISVPPTLAVISGWFALRIKLQDIHVSIDGLLDKALSNAKLQGRQDERDIQKQDAKDLREEGRNKPE